MAKYLKASINLAAAAFALFYATTLIAGQNHPDNFPHPSYASVPDTLTPEVVHEAADKNKIPDESISAQDEVELTGKFATLARVKGLDKSPKVKQAIAMLTDKILADAYKAYFMRQISPSEAEIHNYYNLNKSDYNLYSLSHILVKFKKDPSKLSLEDARKIEAEALNKARAIRARIEAGADFHELAANLSDDASSRADGGRVPETMARYLAPDFKSQILLTKKGEVTPPIKSAFGYHLIMVEEVVPSNVIGNRADIINDIREGKLAEKQISMISPK
ncbi:peptidylprolyl isomerase [Burkholderia plantarii]|uniref:peptidylprolyl isomerase n=1 Tax=Burkholderia plantarii TaxID=41899 RepID=UPI0018DEBC51|nr:peptidylprolyl isomerase [Burkholderia plantarii]MBI0330128.1 peptidylprolyl isomerase [Burkholderia plantarii]